MTLIELARELGLSPSTISRAISRPDLVAAETRERILAAVEAHGYRPNGIARSLRRGESNTIGVIVSDLKNPFYSTVAKAIENQVSDHGYSCVICDADESAEKEAHALELLAQLKVRGIIHAFTGGDVDTLRRLQAEGMPLIEIDRRSDLPGVDAVLLDNALGARLAAEHLLGLGHRRIAIVSGPERLTTGRQRLEGFRKALANAGVTLDDEYTEIGDFREASGYQATSRLLQLDAPPTALFVANNEMMAGALSALREAGVNIPRQISLISFDDVRWAKYVDPPLTIIAQPTEQFGAVAAELFWERLHGRTEPVVRILSPSLVVRESCAPVTPAPAGEVAASAWRRGGDAGKV
ncbi:MAG: LacI family DNA-binding transcriptional regulator [Trueperaceae bacterium]